MLFCARPSSAEVVEIGVFGLFRPTELRVTPVSGALLVTSGDWRVRSRLAGENGCPTLAHKNLRPSGADVSACQPIFSKLLILEGSQTHLISLTRISGLVQVSALDGGDADFQLSIPGKIERRFHGILTVHAGDHKLIAVVAMEREVAVASVVAAEMPRSTPMEALKAQAVVARAYYAAAGPRHDDFDFCDTTHCQFLRAWPEPMNDAFRAARETRGLVLGYLGSTLAAQYSASCGGRTRSLDGDASGYRYYSVTCDFCRRHAPGVVEGHQLGLCQKGAAGMAASGAGYREILDHYYPGTSVMQSGAKAIFW